MKNLSRFYYESNVVLLFSRNGRIYAFILSINYAVIFVFMLIIHPLQLHIHTLDSATVNEQNEHQLAEIRKKINCKSSFSYELHDRLRLERDCQRSFGVNVACIRISLPDDWPLRKGKFLLFCLDCSISSIRQVDLTMTNWFNLLLAHSFACLLTKSTSIFPSVLFHSLVLFVAEGNPTVLCCALTWPD